MISPTPHSITVGGNVRIETKHGLVDISVWSDGSISFETRHSKRERRYWLCDYHKGRILEDSVSRRLKQKLQARAK